MKEGYWGSAQVRWDSDSSSKYIHITVNGIEKTLFLIGSAQDRQIQQFLLLKNSQGILKAFIMTNANEDQFKQSIVQRKAYIYSASASLKIQDGDEPCKKCKGTGKIEVMTSVKVKDKNFSGTKLMPTKEDCPICKGTGKIPKFINVPEVKILE